MSPVHWFGTTRESLRYFLHLARSVGAYDAEKEEEYRKCDAFTSWKLCLSNLHQIHGVHTRRPSTRKPMA
jgi:hypothetical protein